MMSAKKILVVDDEPVILNLLEDAFSKLGYSVYLAGDAKEALEILKQEPIPLMFIDLDLGSINGLELCMNIRKDNPGAFIYALTGYTGFYKPQEIVKADFDGILDKPIRLEDLYRITKESFEKLDNRR
jgi:CheY-like chemotaxis protein